MGGRGVPRNLAKFSVENWALAITQVNGATWIFVTLELT